MMKKRSVILGVILLLVSGSVFAHTSRIKWEPTELKPVSIAPGESMTIEVTIENVGLMHITDTHHLAVVAEGDIADYVSVTLASSSPVVRRRDKLVAEVTITSPEDMPLSVKAGYLSLMRILPNGREKHEREERKLWHTNKLPVELTFSSELLPPDPGDAGNETLLGIDSDADGVRDDINRYIAFTYPDSQKVREALKQEARELSVFLQDADSKESSRQHALEETGQDCLMYAYGGSDIMDEAIFDAFDQADSQLRAEFLNTRERSYAYKTADYWLGGMVFKLTPKSELKSKCTFDPDALPN